MTTFKILRTAYRMGLSLARNHTNGKTTSASKANIQRPKVTYTTLKSEMEAIDSRKSNVTPKKSKDEIVREASVVD